VVHIHKDKTGGKVKDFGKGNPKGKSEKKRLGIGTDFVPLVIRAVFGLDDLPDEKNFYAAGALDPQRPGNAGLGPRTGKTCPDRLIGAKIGFDAFGDANACCYAGADTTP